MIIFQGLAHRLSHCFVAGKMDHGIDVFFLENLIHAVPIQHIHTVKVYFFAGDLLHPVYRFLVGIIEVIHNHHIVPIFQEFHTGMASNIAGSPCY